MNNNELKADLKELANSILTYIVGPRLTGGRAYEDVMNAIKRDNVQIVIGLKAEKLKFYPGRRATVPPGLLELLAAREHEQWQRWMTYMFNNLSRVNIDRWVGQMNKDYADLTEAEKNSDRMEARIMIQEILDYNEGEM